MDMKPKYKHDCESCSFMGNIIFENREEDVWAHCDSVIFRRSSKPDDYWSMNMTYIDDFKAHDAKKNKTFIDVRLILAKHFFEKARKEGKTAPLDYATGIWRKR